MTRLEVLLVNLGELGNGTYDAILTNLMIWITWRKRTGDQCCEAAERL
jgi:hypothetical protein